MEAMNKKGKEENRKIQRAYQFHQGLCQDSPSSRRPSPLPFIRLYPTHTFLPAPYIPLNLRILLSQDLSLSHRFCVSGEFLLFSSFILFSPLPPLFFFFFFLLFSTFFAIWVFVSLPLFGGLSSDLSLVVGFSSMLVFLDQLCFVFYVGFGYFWGGGGGGGGGAAAAVVKDE